MKLVLTMIQGPARGTKREIDAESLSVGRGEECGWPIADPDRILSKQHLRIDFREGQYVLTDTSTNGVFLNGSATPLGRDRQVILKQGDRVGLGPAIVLSAGLVMPTAAEDPFLAALVKPPEPEPVADDEDDIFAPLPAATRSRQEGLDMPPLSHGAAIPDDFDLDLSSPGDAVSVPDFGGAPFAPAPPVATASPFGAGGIPDDDDWLGSEPAPAANPFAAGSDEVTAELWRFARTVAGLHPDSRVAASPFTRAPSAAAAAAMADGPQGEDMILRLFADLQELVLSRR